jgi:hypothetical protein
MVPTKTMMTFDKGGEWKPLKAPRRDHKGEPIDCDGCSLHLNGKTSGFLGPVYSSASSTGERHTQTLIEDSLPHSCGECRSMIRASTGVCRQTMRECDACRQGRQRTFAENRGSHITGFFQ